MAGTGVAGQFMLGSSGTAGKAPGATVPARSGRRPIRPPTTVRSPGRVAAPLALAAPLVAADAVPDTPLPDGPMSEAGPGPRRRCRRRRLGPVGGLGRRR